MGSRPRGEAVRLANVQKFGLSGLFPYDRANYDGRAMKRKIKLDKESHEVIERQLDAFRKKFGREPGPEDPIFFDPDAETPQEYPEHKFQRDWNELMDEATRSGAIRPELAYAAKKTGFIVTEANKEKLSKQQLEEWDNAVQEYLDSASRKIH